MGKNKKVPKTKYKTKAKPVHYNITEMVTRFLAAANLKRIMEEKKYTEEASFFSGLVQGYSDWFNSLQITSEKFKEVQGSVDKKEVIDKVEAMYGNIIARRKGTDRRIVLPNEGRGFEREKKKIDEAWRRKFND